LLGEVRIVVPTTDDLTAKHFDVVAVTSERLVSESLSEQVEQERLEKLGQMPAERNIAVVDLP